MARHLHLLLAVFSMFSTGCAQIVWTAALTPSAVAEATTRSHRTVDITVIDADTLDPLPDTEVVMLFGGWFRPDNCSFVTDAAGQRKTRLVNNRGGAFEINREGYLRATDSRNLPDPLPKAFTIRAVRAPAPYHVLEVPSGFRGLTTLDVPRNRPRETSSVPGDPDWPRKQRAWVTRLNEGVNASLPFLPVTDYGTTSEEYRVLRAQTADGTELPLLMGPLATSSERFTTDGATRMSDATLLSDDDDVAMWLIAIDRDPRTAGMRYRLHFFVGKRVEAEQAQAGLRTTTRPATERWKEMMFPALR